ncbi:helix-turn-helix transcriptional regulator [Rhodoblastus sp.]|jgi:transcriptional regulator with XRE-family HTH domain|uniref:helix-turn-helix domain-containing protein n=1 Tax=Rhodoblastus sp. TaxID=1962975 RepID=UPI0025EC0F57|nr:helix-turn-helix transcriptional regulator [Rhodoblastus sp.]
MSLGSKLRELRTRKRESLQQLADAVGASKAHIWELETEKSTNPSLELLKKIAAHFTIQVSTLLEEQETRDALIFGREFEGLTDDDKKLLWQMAERIAQKKPESNG